MFTYFGIVIILCGLNSPYVMGICSDSALENVTNRQVMKDGGWKVDGAPEHSSDYALYCDAPNTFWGYKFGSNTGFVEATFKGSGRATLEFGNCYHKGGVVKVYLNADEIGVATKLEMSKVISFNYSRGDVLNITEEYKGEGGIIKINSLKLEECEEKDKDEDKKCEDKVTWCETAKPKCVDEIKESCQKYCGICKDEDEDKKCEDKVTWCEAAKPECVDEIKEKCPKYCGVCKDTDEDKKCNNKATWCEAAEPNCNVTEIKESCQKYCGLCKEKYETPVNGSWCSESKPIGGRDNCMTDTECLDNARDKCDNNKDCFGIAWFPSNPKQPLRLCESPKTVPKEDGWRVIMKSTTMPKVIDWEKCCRDAVPPDECFADPNFDGCFEIEPPCFDC